MGDKYYLLEIYNDMGPIIRPILTTTFKEVAGSYLKGIRNFLLLTNDPFEKHANFFFQKSLPFWMK